MLEQRRSRDGTLVVYAADAEAAGEDDLATVDDGQLEPRDVPAGELLLELLRGGLEPGDRDATGHAGTRTRVASRPPTWTPSILPSAPREKYPFIPFAGPSGTTYLSPSPDSGAIGIGGCSSSGVS